MAQEKGVAGVFISIRAGLARAIMGIVPPKDIEDIVQETYVRVCQAGKKEQIREPRSFLYQTARNLAIDHAKRAESRLTTSIEVTGEWEPSSDRTRPHDETLDQASSSEEFALFCEAVRHLPIQCRRAFVLKKVYGYTQREIAAELGISESTVEKHIAQGIKRCTYFMMHQNRETASGHAADKHGDASWSVRA